MDPFKKFYGGYGFIPGFLRGVRILSTNLSHTYFHFLKISYKMAIIVLYEIGGYFSGFSF